MIRRLLPLILLLACMPKAVLSQETRPTDAATSPSATQPQPARIWKQMDLNGSVVENAPPLVLFGGQLTNLQEIREHFERLAEDERVEGVLLKIGAPEMGFARTEELRTEIIRFRQKGKKVHAILTDGNQTGYLIASGCNRITMVPSGVLILTGLRVEGIFLKNLLDRLGIHAELISIGQYKDAGEPLTRVQWSQPAREAMEALANDLYEQMISLIAQGRRLQIDNVRQLIDEGPFTADEALKHGLVDELAYETEVIQQLKSQSGRQVRVESLEPAGRAAQPIQPFDIFGGLFGGRPRPRPVSGDKIALIYATGPIVPSMPESSLFPQSVIAPDEMREIFEKCLKDPSIKAVVLRIDSPGGDATASDIIWRDIRRLGDTKPVVASMGDVAASGGYYIAMGASHVLAHPGTITGSIGVLGGKVALTDMLAKLSITTDSVSRGRNAGIFSPMLPFTETERAAMQRILVEIYENFTAKVAISRGMPAPQVEEVAQGRVWSGRQASQVGLVDQLGGLQDAINLAREQAGLKDEAKVELLVFPEAMTIQDLLEKILTGQAAVTGGIARDVQALLPRVIRENLPMLTLFDAPRPLALMPFLVSVQ